MFKTMLVITCALMAPAAFATEDVGSSCDLNGHATQTQTQTQTQFQVPRVQPPNAFNVSVPYNSNFYNNVEVPYSANVNYSSRLRVDYPFRVNSIHYIRVRTSSGRFVDAPIINNLMPEIFENEGVIRYNRRIRVSQNTLNQQRSQGYVQYYRNSRRPFSNNYPTNFNPYVNSYYPNGMNQYNPYAQQQNGFYGTMSQPYYPPQVNYQSIYANENDQAPVQSQRQSTGVENRKPAAPAMDEGPSTSRPSSKDTKQDEVSEVKEVTNKVCPITGEDISGTDYKLTVDGKTTYFCCEDCLKTAKDAVNKAISDISKKE